MHETISLTSFFATFFFGCALIHTFLIKRFEHLALRYREGSVAENFFHILAEVETVFGIWGALFILSFLLLEGPKPAINYLEGLHFNEAIFVFAIMTVAATKPILQSAENTIRRVSKLLPFESSFSFYISCLILGPLLGSFVTEPAAMTVTALLLKKNFFDREISERFKYASLGLLFVNISIGGTLTHFAAPPVIMVASKWNWGLGYMLSHFGWKAILAVCIGTCLTAIAFRRELFSLTTIKETPNELKLLSAHRFKTSPFWITCVHWFFLASLVLTLHHPVVLFGFFLFFLGFVSVTNEYQDELKIRQALLVSFFLGGLVVLGTPQSWWLKPILASLNPLPLFLGATGLTAITDNAALTYLGSLVPNLSENAKYALVAGSVVGGGLTVIANAPNPVGFGILSESFGKEGISPLRLLRSALLPTLLAGICFWGL